LSKRNLAQCPTFSNRASASFGELPSAADIAMENAARRISEPVLDDLVLLGCSFAEITGSAGKCPACPGCANERVHRALCLLPDLRPRRLVVRASISDIVELIGPNRIVQRCRISLRLMVVVLRVLKRDGCR